MKQSTKSILKRIIIPLILVIIYLAVVAVLAYYADQQSNGILDFDYATNFLLTVILTAPPLVMFFSVIFWIAEFIIYKQYRLEKNHIIISSAICGIFFLIGVFTFILLTLGIF